MSCGQEDGFIQVRSLLHYNVPRFIEHIAQRGGVTDEEWLWVKYEDDENPSYPSALMSRADEVLLYPTDEATFKKGLFVLVRALAILAFIPHGVRFGGLHFDSKVLNFVENGSKES